MRYVFFLSRTEFNKEHQSTISLYRCVLTSHHTCAVKHQKSQTHLTVVNSQSLHCLFLDPSEEDYLDFCTILLQSGRSCFCALCFSSFYHHKYYIDNDDAIIVRTVISSPIPIPSVGSCILPGHNQQHRDDDARLCSDVTVATTRRPFRQSTKQGHVVPPRWPPPRDVLPVDAPGVSAVPSQPVPAATLERRTGAEA